MAWLTVDGIGFQSYRANVHSTPLISDDARIRIEHHEDFWVAYVDNVKVISCGLGQRYNSEIEAIRTAFDKVR